MNIRRSEPLYVQSDGPDDAPTIIFLHGGGGGGWMWQPQVESLKSNYHCLVPDLPEHGRSMEVKPFSIHGSAEMMAELIRSRAHGGRAHVVGLSEGAQIAVALLSIAPEIVDHAVISSALLRSMPGMGWLTPGLVAVSFRWSVPPFKNWEWWIRLNMKYSAGIPDSYYPEFKETFQNLTEESFVNVIMENQRFRLPVGLEQANSPTLVVAGHKEYGVMRQSVRDLIAVLPEARGCLVDLGRGYSMAQEHNWSMNAPALFTDMIKTWIEGTPIPELLKPLA
jgi:pimeloyl-ACP methyl ester carboxylesterase